MPCPGSGGVELGDVAVLFEAAAQELIERESFQLTEMRAEFFAEKLGGA
jgi:hypothetical protein